MIIRGFQTWLTVAPQYVFWTCVPFTMGGGVRLEMGKGRIGVFDIVIMGFGLSFEWPMPLQGDQKNVPRSDT